MKIWMRCFGWGLVFFGLVACEEEFAGKREENSEVINGPFSMKVVSLSGSSYLAVLNTNFQFKKRNGSIQFYSLGADPTLQTSPAALSVPSNASDFEILNDKLYLLNRREKELWVYELSSGVFSRSLDAAGDETFLKLPSNSMQIYTHTRTSDSKKFLAVVAQRAGTLSLIDPETLTYLNPATVVSGSLNAGKIASPDIYGTTFYMTARQSQVANKDDSIGVSGLTRSGYGLTGVVPYGDTGDLFVGFSLYGLAAYVYSLGTFQNTANFTWQLPAFEKSTTLDSGIKRRGTGEKGFRGIDKDDAGNIFLSSRSDNSIYILSKSEIEAGKSKVGNETEALRNTTGFAKNSQSHRLDFTFGGESDLTDKNFSKLGNILVNKSDFANPASTVSGTATNSLWALSLDEDKVYRIPLSVADTTWTAGTAVTASVGHWPQRMVTDGNYLYVANPGDGEEASTGGSIHVLGLWDLALQKILKTP